MEDVERAERVDQCEITAGHNLLHACVCSQLAAVAEALMDERTSMALRQLGVTMDMTVTARYYMQQTRARQLRSAFDTLFLALNKQQRDIPFDDDDLSNATQDWWPARRRRAEIDSSSRTFEITARPTALTTTPTSTQQPETVAFVSTQRKYGSVVRFLEDPSLIGIDRDEWVRQRDR